jgi:hypothetical protein
MAETDGHLIYFIYDQVLFGRVNGLHFQMHAVAGGRAGSTNPKVVNKAVANNPYRTAQGEDTAKGIVGGPLPCGKYTLKVDAARHNWINLIPDKDTWMTGRTGGFAIHGHGPIGSQGCIVPDLFSDLQSLVRNVKTSPIPVTLTVVAGSMDDMPRYA